MGARSAKITYSIRRANRVFANLQPSGGSSKPRVGGPICDPSSGLGGENAVLGGQKAVLGGQDAVLGGQDFMLGNV